CLASCPPHLYAPTDRARSGPTLDGHSHPLQSGRSGQTVQGPDPPPPSEFLPRQSAAAPCHGLAVSRPTPRRQLVVRLPTSPTSTGHCPSHATHDAPQRCQATPASTSSASFSLPSSL